MKLTDKNGGNNITNNNTINYTNNNMNNNLSDSLDSQKIMIQQCQIISIITLIKSMPSLFFK